MSGNDAHVIALVNRDHGDAGIHVYLAIDCHRKVSQSSTELQMMSGRNDDQFVLALQLYVMTDHGNAEIYVCS